ncbi:hypothetical protein HXA34_19160 [Salipaludibacillus agaradhaerens]|uniref:hypothetical protein n=1 Tax=Salipaludibacillus agaradhaerens TaxID=76935 RepID=UPI00215079F8|nr:hypothetical protein [Salipaludibacillus agaradhaerens]MCR6108424.1 hypothetical protein [Salipaludibacillus agaradhaerens]MCR6120446.1 hypothetical protein [Salipaludibacillus agaradhaerens]UJW59453.1 hypothetical protein HXZ66_19585 [Bacillus sp. A116_S68]
MKRLVGLFFRDEATSEKESQSGKKAFYITCLYLVVALFLYSRYNMWREGTELFFALLVPIGVLIYVLSNAMIAKRWRSKNLSEITVRKIPGSK